MWTILVLVCCMAFSVGLEAGGADASLDLLVEELKKEIKEMKQEIIDLKEEKSQEIASLVQTIAELKKQNSQEMGTLHQTITDLSNEKAHEIGFLHQTIRAVAEREHGHFEELAEKVSRLHQAPVMFHARLSQDRAFADGSIIVFDEVDTNIGDAYEPSVGVFRCPVAGYYHFFASFDSRQERSRGRFMMDGVEIQAGPLTSNEGHNRSGQSSQAVNTFCAEGSTVHIRAVEINPAYIAADLIGQHSVFSGFLVTSQTEGSL